MIAVDRDPSAPGFRFADRRAIISVEDEPQIDRLATAERVDGLIAPGIDWPVAIAARIAERLALRHPIDPATAVLATSKLRQRERFAEAGVPHPRHVVCATIEEASAAADGFGFPCVVKAPDRQGQKGLVLARAEEQLADAFALALAESRSNVVLVEELVPGREVTVNAFSIDGRFTPLTVTDRVVAEPPAFGVALAHEWPSSLAPDQVGAAVDAARAAAGAIGVREGPTYTQVVVGERGAHVVELAARLGGGHDAELCAAALDVDLNALALSAALGEDRRRGAAPPGRQRRRSVRSLSRARAGRARAGRRCGGGGGARRGRVGARVPRAGSRSRPVAPGVGPGRGRPRPRCEPGGSGGARWAGGGLRTLRHCRCRRSCPLGEPPFSVSSRLRSARRRSRRWRRRSAPAG